MPLMLLAWQVTLGKGTSRSQQQPPDVQRDAMKMNFAGSPDACSPILQRASDLYPMTVMLHVFGTVFAT